MQTERMEKQESTLAGIPVREGKYLTFSLSGEEYGISILKVKEIIGIMPVTHVPQTPDFVKGVINLRGKVIPVVDLRLRFALQAAAYTCIIVVEVAGASGHVMMGIVVDAVSEVLNIRGADIENTPAFGVRLNTDFILGMAKAAGGIKILLEIDKVLNSEDLVAIRHMA
jgi:purine-binding chemotaxis protein CheW